MLPQSRGVTDVKPLRTPDRAPAAGRCGGLSPAVSSRSHLRWWCYSPSRNRLAGSAYHRRKAPTSTIPPATVALGGYTTPPWPAPADATAAVNAAGLPMLGREGNVEHIHAHLDVLVDGQAVPVPADIGIDVHRRTISPLHTHDGSGVLHIESPVKRQFSLGEFFSEWQVSLSEDNIGALRAGGGKVVRVFVNGTQRNGNPGAIMLGAHDEIAVLFDRPQPGETIPRNYDFSGGL